MQVLPIDLTAIVAVIMGMLVVLIPIAGVTARFALKPLVESLAAAMQSRDEHQALQITERRVALLEQQVESLESLTERLRDERDFERELRGGPAGAALKSGSEATPDGG